MKKYPRYRECNLSWLGTIPEHWEIQSFKNILSERNEKNNPIKSIERLSLSIDKGVTLYSEKTTNLDRFKDDFTQYKLAYKGDLVLNSMNMIVGAVGVSNYFGCVSPVYYTYYGGIDNLNSTKFYEYLFKSKIIQSVLFSLGKGLIAIDRGEGKYNTLRLKVSRGDLRTLQLPLPTQEEQICIANFLDYKIAKIDRFIRKKKQLIKLLNEQKAAIINQAVTKGLDPNVKMKDSGIEWLGEIPEHWEEWKLNRLAKKITQGPNPDYNIGKPSFEYKVLKTKDIYDHVIHYQLAHEISKETFTSESKSELIDGDILITIVGHGSIGKAKIFKKQVGVRYIFSRAIGLLRLKDEYIIMQKFVEAFFHSSSGKIIFDLGTDGSTGQEIVKTSFIKKIKIPLPPISEQELIIEFIREEEDKILKTISTIEKEIALTQEYKTALIAEAVTGKIDVRDFVVPDSSENETYEDLEEELGMVAEDEVEYGQEEMEE